MSDVSMPIWRQIGVSPVPHTQDESAILIVGGGPVGLTLALDLGRRGHSVVVLNRLDFVAGGSRAICFSKRSIEIFDRLGVGNAMMEKGVSWNKGRVFRGRSTEPIYEFDLLPDREQKRPAFINIQQYHVEDRLIDALAALPNVELRWGHEVVGVAQDDVGVTAQIRVGEATYAMGTPWLIACDGSRSAVRKILDLPFDGRGFEDNFLIVDVRLTSDRPAERWFWFDPPFNPGRSALLHKQPDDIWRLDFQLGPNIDRVSLARPEVASGLVRSMLGVEVEFQPVWSSIYSFRCCRIESFVHDRIIFAGDSAHLVSPFGARGCNGGLADAANLGWKLDAVISGAAQLSLLDSYEYEAGLAADTNIRASTRATDFIAPGEGPRKTLRDAVLDLAQAHDFARPLVNSGRLSTAITYTQSPLSTPDCDCWRGSVQPGEPAIDAPLPKGWLSDALGDGFTLLANGWSGAEHPMVEVIDVAPCSAATAIVRERYALTAGAAVLFRPDHYVAARWKSPSAEDIATAVRRCLQ